MRILPYELYKYASDLSLCALRKEFGMHDYCLNMNLHNKAMQPFLNMGRNYFILSIKKWVKEMQKRNHYINTFHLFYAKNNFYQKVQTPFFLILECLIQWNIKEFIPYETDLSWYNIANQLFLSFCNKTKLDIDIYNKLLLWYKMNFMKLNSKVILKPHKLNMQKIIDYFHKYLLDEQEARILTV